MSIGGPFDCYPPSALPAMTDPNLARPYPETIEALESRLCEAEHENEALRLRLQGKDQTIEHQAKQDGERIAALEQVIDQLTSESAGFQRALARVAVATGQHDIPPTRAEQLARLGGSTQDADLSPTWLEAERDVDATKDQD